MSKKRAKLCSAATTDIKNADTYFHAYALRIELVFTYQFYSKNVTDDWMDLFYAFNI